MLFVYDLPQQESSPGNVYADKNVTLAFPKSRRNFQSQLFNCILATRFLIRHRPPVWWSVVNLYVLDISSYLLCLVWQRNQSIPTLTTGQSLHRPVQTSCILLPLWRLWHFLKHNHEGTFGILVGMSSQLWAGLQLLFLTLRNFNFSSDWSFTKWVVFFSASNLLQLCCPTFSHTVLLLIKEGTWVCSVNRISINTLSYL